MREFPGARSGTRRRKKARRGPTRTLAECVDPLHPVPMASPIIISIAHQLGRAEARRRIEGGFAKIIQLLPGSTAPPTQHWEGDRLEFSVAALGQTVSGVIQVFDTTVAMEIQLPGVLHVIAGGLKDRLQKVGQLLLTRK